MDESNLKTQNRLLRERVKEMQEREVQEKEDKAYHQWLASRYGSVEAYLPLKRERDEERRRKHLMDMNLTIIDDEEAVFKETDLTPFEVADFLKSSMADITASIYEDLTDGVPVTITITRGKGEK